MANKTNKANNTISDANASAEAEYRAAVEEGKVATAIISGQQWVLGDLALKVEKVYGENRIQQFALDINYRGNFCTLGRYRLVCRAFPKTGGRPRFFASAQALQTHPDRFAIVENNPDLSKAEAVEIMRQWKAKNAGTTAADLDEDDEPDDEFEEEDTEPTPGSTSTPAKEAKAKGAKKTADAVQADEWSGNSKRWQAEVVVTANRAIDLAEVRKRCSPEQHRDLLAVLEPPHIETVRKAGEALAELAAFLHKLLHEAADTAIQEGRVKTSPKRAKEPRAEA
jgi:hypothetical protein